MYAYGEALRLKPDYDLACVGLGLVHRSQRQYAQAILNFQEALRLEPDAVVAWYALGEAYLRQGSTSQATEVYERLKILDPVRADSFLRNILHPGPEAPPMSVARSEGQGMAMVQEEFESEADDEIMGLRRRDDPRQQLLQKRRLSRSG
ncbi:MAG: tetratricopeptide repeat protein [candidate division NC10 bacterium]|nr:tetratricopeptide repeat protein [candidate division NC10 bacterium]